jgi:dynein heavy chain
VYGLFLEGASWDIKKGILTDQNPGEMYCKMPMICFETQFDKPRNAVEENIEGENEEEVFTYSCPVFKTSKRAQIISSSGSSNDKIIEIVKY